MTDGKDMFTELAVTTSGSGLAHLVAGGTSGSLSVGMPFSQPICLVENTRVAGTTYISDIESIVEGLAPGSRLALVRDSGNAHDRWAIKVFAPCGRRCGFVSCDCNEIPARLMDGGKMLYGEVTSTSVRGRWHIIEMAVYLDD